MYCLPTMMYALPLHFFLLENVSSYVSVLSFNDLFYRLGYSHLDLN